MGVGRKRGDRLMALVAAFVLLALAQLDDKVVAKGSTKKGDDARGRMTCAVCEYIVESLDRTVRDRMLNNPQLTEIGFRLRDDGTREVHRMPWVQTELGFAELFEEVRAVGAGEGGLCDRTVLSNTSLVQLASKSHGKHSYLVHPDWRYHGNLNRYIAKYGGAGLKNPAQPMSDGDGNLATRACADLIDDHEDALGLAVRDPERMRVYVRAKPM